MQAANSCDKARRLYYHFECTRCLVTGNASVTKGTLCIQSTWKIGAAFVYDGLSTGAAKNQAKRRLIMFGAVLDPEEHKAQLEEPRGRLRILKIAGIAVCLLLLAGVGTAVVASFSSSKSLSLSNPAGSRPSIKSSSGQISSKHSSLTSTARSISDTVAVPPTVLERTRNWVVEHKRLVGVVAAVLVIVIAASIVLGVVLTSRPDAASLSASTKSSSGSNTGHKTIQAADSMSWISYVGIAIGVVTFIGGVVGVFIYLCRRGVIGTEGLQRFRSLFRQVSQEQINEVRAKIEKIRKVAVRKDYNTDMNQTHSIIIPNELRQILGVFNFLWFPQVESVAEAYVAFYSRQTCRDRLILLTDRNGNLLLDNFDPNGEPHMKYPEEVLKIGKPYTELIDDLNTLEGQINELDDNGLHNSSTSDSDSSSIDSSGSSPSLIGDLNTLKGLINQLNNKELHKSLTSDSDSSSIDSSGSLSS